MVLPSADSVVPAERVRLLNQGAWKKDGDYVLYWMVAFRRGRYNFALQRAAEWSRNLRKPLLVLEALRCGYPWAGKRLHAFVIQGMADNARFFADAGVTYWPYLEPEPGAGRGLLAALARRASVVVTDDFPCFFLPRMIASAASRCEAKMEAVDANGLLPLQVATKTFHRAFDFRRFLQRRLPTYLQSEHWPLEYPLELAAPRSTADVPRDVVRTWRAADVVALASDLDRLSEFPIDQKVAPAPACGGEVAAQQVLAQFVEHRLPNYADGRNDPSREVGSGLSPYLHFGHISPHEVFFVTSRRAGWTLAHLTQSATGSAQGWWGAPPELEAFWDQLITWRELGYNMCRREPDYDQYESLPEWARKTLRDHEQDRRPHLYDLAALETASTHDELWNASQRQLVREGRIHNYLRMLWGKKILEWSASPRQALDAMIELNNKYALDGRNPNSYSGIFWVLGRYDRAWGPERPIFGKIRYMSSENTARKLSVREYLRRYAARRVSEG